MNDEKNTVLNSAQLTPRGYRKQKLHQSAQSAGPSSNDKEEVRQQNQKITGVSAE
jgi:hypothetical protein